MRNLRKKVYEDYQIIKINNIEGGKINLKNEHRYRAYKMAIRRVYREGIRKPFEVIKKENKYILMSNPITFNAAKSLNYSAVPCLIRNPLHELILNKMLKTLDVE